MAVTKEEILDSVANMSVMDVVDLIKMMEDKFDVSAQAAAPVMVAPSGDGAAVVEKTEFDLVLTSFGASKVPVIKVVRSLTGLGLKEAKDLVEGAPSTVKEAITKDEAEGFKKQLEEVGASVEVK